MKIFAISDLHLSTNSDKPMDIFGGAWGNYVQEIGQNWHECVDHGDLVLIAGDISWAMTFEQAKADLEYLAALPGKKVILRGNHDYWWKSISYLRTNFPEGIYAVQNDCLRFDNFLIFGSRGWVSPEGKQAPEDEKIYNREIERMKLSAAAMKKMRREGDRVIAMTHYPPFNSRREGSPFTDIFEEADCESVVFGHLHGRGVRMNKFMELGGVKYYLTSCDQIANYPVLVAEG